MHENAMTRGESHHTRRVPALALVFSAALVLVATLALLPVSALAMTTNKATARPNEDGGSGVIGAMDTRLTWEGTVGDDEEVSSITLSLPEGATFDHASTRITVLDGLNRTSIDGTATSSGNSVDVQFSESIPAGSLVRLEITNMQFPADGGDYVVSGSYTTADGQSHALDDSAAITVIANTPLQAAVGWLDSQEWVAAWNSVPFLGMFLKPQLLLTSFASLFPGWLVCLGIVLACYPFAIVLGLAFAMLKTSRHKVLRAIAICYINILRGTPLFLQIYIMFFGLPMVGINIDNNVLGVIVMAVNSSAYLAEIFRAGIQSIPQPVRGSGLPGHERLPDHDIHHPAADRAPRHSHGYQRLHHVLQGHVAALLGGRHGAHDVLEEPYHHLGQHHAVHGCRHLLPHRDAAAHQDCWHHREQHRPLRARWRPQTQAPCRGRRISAGL